MSSSQHFIRGYFNRFPDFHYDQSKETMGQFRRLASQEDWSPKKRRKEKRALQTALVLQFNDTYGENEAEIANWQGLCRAMRIDPIPETVAECKKLFRRTHVNIVDLVDTRGTGRRVPTYPTVDLLADYTKETGKFFPREHAKAGGLLKYLLREILASGTGGRH
ncbi:hypothetical protein BDY19DRAFT_108732 [Irpex rosettiformis]|uniref:Uncharacterized protein n=1 Tax=Irpex rosettiformis TaxID=378272 RepID=A0ACB8U5Q8_9APHY|nr:hypothetical protein BDY19DRAFT_108732 [Irpex rosettiformis]